MANVANARMARVATWVARVASECLLEAEVQLIHLEAVQNLTDALRKVGKVLPRTGGGHIELEVGKHLQGKTTLHRK